MFTNIYDTLTALNMDGEPEGILAEKWEISTDGTQYTFHLRQGIKFHDGTDFNADAVKFTYDRLVDPKTNAPAASWISGYESAKVIDEHTVTLQLKAPFSPLMGNTSIAYFGILSPTAVQKEGTNFGHKPVGTGPFMFKEWIPQQTITLVRNPNYQNFHSYDKNKGAPYLDSLVFKNIPEAQTQVASLQTGEINLLQLPPHNVADFSKDSNYQVFTDKQSTDITFVEFHMEKPTGEYGAVYKPPFDDLRVRQAVAYAINGDVIIKSVLDGLAVRNYGPMPIGLYGYDPKIQQYGYDYDPDKAKQLLDEAGWKGSGTRSKNGQSLTVQFWTWNDSTQQQVAQVLQNQLNQVGFDVKLTTMEVATLLGRLGKDGDTSNFDLMGWGWGEPDLLYMMTDTTSGVGYYHAEDYRKLVTQARQVSDLPQRGKLYFQAAQVMLKDCAMVPLWSDLTVTAARKEVKDFKLGPQGYYGYMDAYIQKS